MLKKKENYFAHICLYSYMCVTMKQKIFKEESRAMRSDKQQQMSNDSRCNHRFLCDHE